MWLVGSGAEPVISVLSLDNVHEPVFYYLYKVVGKDLGMDLFSLYLDNVVGKALEHEPVFFITWTK